MVRLDIMISVVDHLVKRCREAGKAEKLVKALQALCPGCPVDQIWLLVASFEVFSDLVLDVTTHEFYQGALGMAVPEWMKQNVVCPRVPREDLKQEQWGSVSAPGVRRASFLTRAPPVTF